MFSGFCPIIYLCTFRSVVASSFSCSSFMVTQKQRLSQWLLSPLLIESTLSCWRQGGFLYLLAGLTSSAH